MNRFIELTLHGHDALCIDFNHGFFQPGHPESYSFVCRIPDSWIEASDLLQRLYQIADYVNTEQSNALIRHGAAVGHHLLSSVSYRLLDNQSLEELSCRTHYLVKDDGSCDLIRGVRSKAQTIDDETPEPLGDHVPPPASDDVLCVASKMIVLEGRPVAFMFRKDPIVTNESGWRFLSRYESQQYMGDISNFAICELQVIAESDPAIIPFLNHPVGSAFAKVQETGQFVPAEFPQYEE